MYDLKVVRERSSVSVNEVSDSLDLGGSVAYIISCFTSGIEAGNVAPVVEVGAAGRGVAL